MKYLLVTIIVVGLILPINANAANTVGLNGATCQFSTIFAAISASSQGDTIYIQPGTYNELLGNISQSLTFVPAVNGCTAELTTANSFSVIIDGNGGSFDNTGGLVQVILNPGMILFPTVVTFRHMQLRNAFSENGGIIAVTGGAELVLDDADVTDGIASINGGNVFSTGTPSRRSLVRLVNDSRILRGEALVNGGGVSLNNSRLIIDDGDIDQNIATGDGGGVYTINSTLTLNTNQAKIINNVAVRGGGIYVLDSTIDAEGALINNNQADNNGGGIYANNSLLTLNTIIMDANATILSSSFGQGGGALFLSGDNGVTEIINSQLINNQSNNVGGAIAKEADNTLSITDNTIISNNSARTSGGGLYEFSGVTTISNSTISENTAKNGGGISGAVCDLTINNSNIFFNIATNSGGGIVSQCDNVILIKSTIFSNTAKNGGGLYSNGQEQVSLIDTAISNNHATSNGGGIYSLHSSISITSTFCDAGVSSYCSRLSSNDAERFGGAIYSISDNRTAYSSLLAISDTDIRANKALLGGSAIYQTASHLVISNSIKMTNVLVRDNGDATTQESTIELAENNTVLEIDSATVVGNFGNPLLTNNPKANISLKNSIIYDNTLGPFVASTATLSKACNNTQASAANGQSLGINLGNPLFTTANSKFYHLSINSPSIDACINGPIRDMQGLYRPNTGGMYDQGINERNGATSLPDAMFSDGFE